MEEIWKPIGIEKYMVSNFGNTMGITGDRPMKPQIVGNGHCQIAIRKDGGYKYFYVHRLVGEHFLEKPTADKCLIDHIDKNKINNHFTNLRWVTPQQNSNNRYDSKDPTESVLKKRERSREYKLQNPEKYKLYMKTFNLNGNKTKIAKSNREKSKMIKDVHFQNWRKAMAKVHFIIKLKNI